MSKKDTYEYRKDDLSDSPSLFNWLLAALCAAFIFCSFVYMDMVSLTIWSTNVWDVILDSNIRHLYELSSKNIYGLYHDAIGSELMSVLPWSVWNLPIWAIQRFAGLRIVDSPLMLAWSKLFLAAMAGVMLLYTYRLCMLLTGCVNKSRWCVFLSASSFYMFISVLHTGQNDILMIAASVMAVYYLIKGHRCGFYCLSILALSIKPFYLIAYVAIILLIEKDIIKIILKCLLGISGIAAQKLLFLNAPMYAESLNGGPGSGMLSGMFKENFSTGFGPVSIFAIGIIAIYFYAYTLRFESDAAAFGKYVVYISLLSYMCYLVLIPDAYYRILLLVPFLYLAMVQNKRLFAYNIILDTLMNGAFMLRILLGDLAPFWIVFMEKAIIPLITGRAVNMEAVHNGPFSYIKATVGIPGSSYIIVCSVMAICAVILMAINLPSGRMKLPYQGQRYSRVLVTIRTVMMVPVVIAMYMLAQ